MSEYAEDDEEEEQQELPPELRSVEEMPWKYIKTEDDEGYVSLIINDDGPSDLWVETYPIPDKYPDEWNEKDLVKFTRGKIIDVHKRVIRLLKIKSKILEKGNKILDDEQQLENAQAANQSPAYVPNYNSNQSNQNSIPYVLT